MVRCNTCGGVYSPILADGSAYFHRCPPRSRVELAQLIQAGTLAYPPGTNAATFVAAPTPAGSPIPGAFLAAADAWLALGSIERANLRDENVPPVGSGIKTPMIAAGTGTTPVVVANAVMPAV